MSAVGVKPRRLFMALMLGVLGALLVVGLGSSAQATIKKAVSEKLTVRPGESIQEAVDAASAGDRIVVLGGVYRESVVIRKSGISLQGIKVVIKPPAEPSGEPPCFAPSGICVLGRVDFETGEVSRYVKNVSVSGFTVRNFEGFGIIALGAQKAPRTPASSRTAPSTTGNTASPPSSRPARGSSQTSPATTGRLGST